MRFTPRVGELLDRAHAACGVNPIEPADLLAAALETTEGVLGELQREAAFDLVALRRAARLAPGGAPAQAGRRQLSAASLRMLARAQDLQEEHGQIRIGVGEVVRALLEGPEGEVLLRAGRARVDKDRALRIAATPRDLAVPLSGFTPAAGNGAGDCVIRRAQSGDRDELLAFIRAEHGERWTGQAASTFAQQPATAFLGLVRGEIAGFACYDVVRGERGAFGPMGTARALRGAGIGTRLLYACLADMEARGYPRAVIKNAGPIEFYERVCGAVPLPLHPGHNAAQDSPSS